MIDKFIKLTYNQNMFLDAANWALENHQKNIDVGINIRNLGDIYLLNNSKSLMYKGFTHDYQKYLKGLIVRYSETENKFVEVLVPCFPKFFNMGETEEKNEYKNYLNNNYQIYFTKKVDGVNIRPYFNHVTNQVEFATRGTLLGKNNPEEPDYGYLARQICEIKYPSLLEKEIYQKYSFIFELIHPKARILTNYYEETDLICLAAFEKQNNFKELDLNSFYSIMELGYLDLKFADNWIGNTNFSEFDNAIEKLHFMWNNTDQEGTVVVFVENDVPVYRLKIKNKYYLKILSIVQNCTLRNTKIIAEENNIKNWEDFRNYLYINISSMNEEIEMQYKIHWDNYIQWYNKIQDIKENIFDEYITLLRLHNFHKKKDFANAIQSNKYKTILFSMWDYESKNLAIRDFWKDDLKYMRSLETLHPLIDKELEMA